MDRPIVHLPSVVARLGETEYPEAYGGLTVQPSARKAITMTLYVVAARAVVPSSARYVPLGGSAR
jgi:hypothetical protein